MRRDWVTYLNSILYTDQQVGQIMDRLEEEGMVDFKAFFSLVKELKLNVPYSLHFEYDLLKQKEKSLPEQESFAVVPLQKSIDALEG